MVNDGEKMTLKTSNKVLVLKFEVKRSTREAASIYHFTAEMATWKRIFYTSSLSIFPFSIVENFSGLLLSSLC